MQKSYPIQQLIESRCSQLNISLKEMIREAGYSNISVGLKRLHQLFDADFESSRGLIEQLPKVLAIDKTVLERAITETKTQIQIEVDREYRANFKPNFIIRTGELGRPRQITIAAIVNAGKYIASEFPDNLNSDQYIRYAVDFYEKKKKNISNFFYQPENIIINYSPDKADVISLNGDNIEQLEHSVRKGRLSIQLK